MGGCWSVKDDEASMKSKEIDRELRKEKLLRDSTFKLLLLGSGESGKSTFLKQILLLHEPFSSEEKVLFIQTLRGNAIKLIQAVLQALPLANLTLLPENQQHADYINGLPQEGMLPPEYFSGVITAINALWADPACVETYSKRGQTYHLNDGADYLFGSVERMFSADYFPTEQDLIRAKVKTTGVVEADFVVADHHFRLIDVGGQRSERRKWMHSFDQVTAVLYFVAMSEYDMKLREADANRMIDSLELFEGICGSDWFTQTPIILMLNKMDLFREKIKTVPLTTCFPKYSGKREWEEAADYIKQQFVEKKGKQQLDIHYFVAIDTDNARKVFEATRSALMDKHMGAAGVF